MTPLGTGVACKVQHNLFIEDTFNNIWSILRNQDVFFTDEHGYRRKSVEYQEWNVKKYSVTERNIYKVHLQFHR